MIYTALWVMLLTFFGPRWHSPIGSMPFHKAQKSLDFQGSNPKVKSFIIQGRSIHLTYFSLMKPIHSHSSFICTCTPAFKSSISQKITVCTKFLRG
jgi:hypothetical protein